MEIPNIPRMYKIPISFFKKNKSCFLPDFLRHLVIQHPQLHIELVLPSAALVPKYGTNIHEGGKKS